MTRILTVLAAVAIFFGAVQGAAAQGDSYTCALTRGIMCVPDEGCSDQTLSDMNLPRFVRIDVAAKTMDSLDKAVPRKSKIATVERQDRVIVMHGTELRGWTMSLDQDSGDVTLSAAGDAEGFIAFGACITK